MIKAYLKGQQRNWDLNLGCLAAAYRATPHDTTNLTPNLLMLGREVRLPAEVMFGTGKTPVGDQIASYGEYVSDLRDKMAHAHDVARKHLEKSAVRQKDHYDAKQVVTVYQPGDLVWVLSDLTQLHIAPKLRCAYEGPYLVLKRLNGLDYKVQFDAQGKIKILHHNRLKLYKGDQKLPWSKVALKKSK